MVVRANAVADGQYLSLPSDWLEAINIEITSGDFTPLLQQSIESLDVYRKANDNNSGQPSFFSIIDKTLELAPTRHKLYFTINLLCFDSSVK